MLEWNAHTGNRNHPRKHYHLLEPALTENGLLEGIAWTISIISFLEGLLLNWHKLNAYMKWSAVFKSIYLASMVKSFFGPLFLCSDHQQWPKCREKSLLSWREDGFTNVILQDAAKCTPKAPTWKPTAESIQVCILPPHHQHTHTHTHTLREREKERETVRDRKRGKSWNKDWFIYTHGHKLR